MMKSVFISHESQDVAMAEAIADFLASNNIEPWISTRNIRPGRDYAQEITRAIKACDAMIIICSDTTKNSDHVKNEVCLAFSNKKKLIPYLCVNAKINESLEYYLATQHRVVSEGNRRHDYEQIMAALNDSETSGDLNIRRRGVPDYVWIAIAFVSIMAVVILYGDFNAPDEEVSHMEQHPVLSDNEESSQDLTSNDVAGNNEKIVAHMSADSNLGGRSQSSVTKTTITETTKESLENSFRKSLTETGYILRYLKSELQPVGDDIYVLDRGAYLSGTVKSLTYFIQTDDSFIPLVSEGHISESVFTLLTCPESAKGIIVHVIQHKYGFKTDTFDVPLDRLLASCMTAGFKSYVGIESVGSASVIASLVMVNEPDHYNHVMKVEIPFEVILTRNGVVSIDLNAYVPTGNVSDLYSD